MSAHDAAHTHEPPKWPAIERFVESERRVFGGTPTYVLKPNTTERDRIAVYQEICAKWFGYQISRCGNEISVFGCD